LTGGIISGSEASRARGVRVRDERREEKKKWSVIQRANGAFEGKLF
jgi:hypothetical protein